ncbi:hypothetical protein RB195_010251 [Necator americanus]|uniref:Phlebovirus glycoprotein G2 fusion domain-containing protein n=1 Tax=Necator americanus TaxID=51031 RepID=A0ABR1CX47_NECAM
MLIIWLIKCTRNAKRKGTPNSTSEEETIPMRTFNPHPINIPSALLICVALLALASKDTQFVVACGYFLPFPACTFLRIAHVPKKTQTVFEVFTTLCYKKYDELSLTIISLQKPHSPLIDKRFAVTPMEAMMLPDHYQLPVECESEASALDAFVNCTNRMVCSCENMKAPQTCQCPHDSLQNLRKEVSNVMPIRTPFTEIFSDSKEIYALSKQERSLSQ